MATLTHKELMEYLRFLDERVEARCCSRTTQTASCTSKLEYFRRHSLDAESAASVDSFLQRLSLVDGTANRRYSVVDASADSTQRTKSDAHADATSRVVTFEFDEASSARKKGRISKKQLREMREL